MLGNSQFLCLCLYEPLTILYAYHYVTLSQILSSLMLVHTFAFYFILIQPLVVVLYWLLFRAMFLISLKESLTTSLEI